MFCSEFNCKKSFIIIWALQFVIVIIIIIIWYMRNNILTNNYLFGSSGLIEAHEAHLTQLCPIHTSSWGGSTNTRDGTGRLSGPQLESGSQSEPGSNCRPLPFPLPFLNPFPVTRHPSPWPPSGNLALASFLPQDDLLHAKLVKYRFLCVRRVDDQNLCVFAPSERSSSSSSPQMKVPFTWELLRLMIRKELAALNSRAIVFSGG